MCKNKTGRRKGITLIEMLAVVVIIAILATVVITVAWREVGGAKRGAAKAHIQQIEQAVQMFYMDNTRYPEALKDLTTKPTYATNWKKGGYLKVLPTDPWGGDYFYKVPGPGEHPYVIGSYGADQKEGGEDDNEDVDCWSVYEAKK